jgi:predicted ATP-grasp superfamily ATP-dependent carboligase
VTATPRPAVILAQGVGSLGAARVLGRRGVPVIAVLWDLVTPVRYSRFVRRIVEVPPGPEATPTGSRWMATRRSSPAPSETGSCTSM